MDMSTSQNLNVVHSRFGRLRVHLSDPDGHTANRIRGLLGVTSAGRLFLHPLLAKGACLAFAIALVRPDPARLGATAVRRSLKLAAVGLIVHAMVFILLIGLPAPLVAVILVLEIIGLIIVSRIRVIESGFQSSKLLASS